MDGALCVIDASAAVPSDNSGERETIMKIRNVLCACALAASAIAVSTANASVVWTGAAGNLAAEAEFLVSGSNLVVKLTNTSTTLVAVPADVLTGVYFDVSGSALSLAPSSAFLSAGSIVMNGTSTISTPGGDVGGAFAFKYTAGGLGGSPAVAQRYGIGSAGLGLFGPPDVFPGANVDGDPGVDGLDYGLVTANHLGTNGNTPVRTRNLIKNSVTLTLAGLPSGFDLNRIGGVSFQYGTALNEPRVPGTPTPGTAALMALGGLTAARRRR